MPSPTQSSTPLARIQPAQVVLPSLEEMRADLLRLETKDKDPLVRMLAGSQRTIVDHLRLMATGQRVQGQALKKYIDDKTAALASEVNAAFANLTDPQPETEVTTESAPEATSSAQAEVVPPTAPVATPVPTPSPNAPQMTVTPVVRTGRSQRPAAGKAGAK